MNLLDIALVGILALYMISGMYRGFITSCLSTVGFVAAWFGARRFYQQVARMALSNQTLMAVLNQYLEPESFFQSHAGRAGGRRNGHPAGHRAGGGKAVGDLEGL